MGARQMAVDELKPDVWRNILHNDLYLTDLI